MAMFDDRDFLVSHIRNSFITSDETGMCELILECDDIRPSETPAATKSDELEYDRELAHSPDIAAGMDLVGHRRRSNTAQRLERLKLDKQKQSRIRHIQWKNTNYTVCEFEEHFEKKELQPNLDGRMRKSYLSSQLEHFDSTSNNPFMDYAKYDGRAGGSVPTKKIDIYLTMTSSAERVYPMTVVTLSTARVHQLIGLICWQYTMENREPVLTESNVDAYTLNMVEDDGEVDADFPPLDAREPITKFGFKKLALVAKLVASSQQSVVRSQQQNVTVQTADGSVYKLAVDVENTLTRDIVSQVLRLRNIDEKPGVRYRLERQALPGVAIDLDITVSTLLTTDFCVIRENSAWPVDGSDEANSDSHQYKLYHVNICHKLRSSTPAQLGVSGDRIELNPVSNTAGGSNRFSRHSLLFSRPKSITVLLKEINACVLLDDRTTAGK